MGQIPPEYADLIKKLMPDFSNVNAYLYSQWFSKNLQQVGAILAVVLLGDRILCCGRSRVPLLAAACDEAKGGGGHQSRAMPHVERLPFTQPVIAQPHRGATGHHGS